MPFDHDDRYVAMRILLVIIVLSTIAEYHPGALRAQEPIAQQIDFNVDGITDELNNMSFNMDLKRHLTMIFKEGLNNSLRYSKSNKVILSSALRADEFEIILEDNGIGFETDDSYKGNGLKNMKKRAETLNADFVIVSEPGKGTRISLKGKFAIKSVNYN